MAKERCAFCGALNLASAQWCGQCLRQFPPEEMAIGPTSVGSTEGVSGAQSEAEVPTFVPRPSGSDRPAVKAAKTGTRGAFTVTDAGITWTCERCDATNPLEAQTCSVCGTTFAEILRPKDTRPERDPNMAALISLFLPGAGHMYLRLWPEGIARAIVSLWVMSVVFTSLLAGGRGNAAALTITFGIVAVALWVIGAHDAYREARGEDAQVVLKGKVFLYLVLGLLMLLFLLLVSAGLSSRA